jgi:hypothetical protein
MVSVLASTAIDVMVSVLASTAIDVMVSVLASTAIDVMVSVLASTAIDCGFHPWSGQTKEYKIGMCCFSTKHETLRRKSKD